MADKTFVTIGASNHSRTGPREINDFYATPPEATELLVGAKKFDNRILEPMCGGGHIAEVLKQHGYEVEACDLNDYGYGKTGVDFFQTKEWDGDIISNPPYSRALEFCEKGLEILNPGARMAFFLKLTFLEGQKRKQFFEKNPPKTILVCSKRLNCAKGGDFERYGNGATAMAWFIWEKGYEGYPLIEWI